MPRQVVGFLVGLILSTIASAPSTAGAVFFEDYPQSGTSLVLQGKGALRSVSIRMGQGCPTSGPCLPFIVSPTSSGATLELFNTAGHPDDVVCAAMPKELWSVSTTYKVRYRDRGLAIGTVQSAATRFGLHHAPEIMLRASGRNPAHPLTYTLDEPTQGSVGVILSLPRGRFCVDSGGLVCQTDADCLPPTAGSCQDTTLRMCAEFTTPTKDAPGVFRAKSAAPAACPDAPPCP